MDEIRKGQIAVLALKNKLRKDGIHLSPRSRREIASNATDLGISVDEAMEFIEGLVRELVDETFRKPTTKEKYFGETK